MVSTLHSAWQQLCFGCSIFLFGRIEQNSFEVVLFDLRITVKPAIGCSSTLLEHGSRLQLVVRAADEIWKRPEPEFSFRAGLIATVNALNRYALMHLF
jgi:hypothetical protein